MGKKTGLWKKTTSPHAPNKKKKLNRTIYSREITRVWYFQLKGTTFFLTAVYVQSTANRDRIMDYLAVEFVCRTLSCAQFPPYMGSMLRGGLGTQLRRAVCLVKNKECQDCMLAGSCIFPKLFIAGKAPDQFFYAPQLPPPYCLEPPKLAELDLPSGTQFTFGLKLFSYAVQYLPYFIYAISLAGQKGLGRGVNQGFGKYTIEDVRQNGVSVYDAAKDRLFGARTETLEKPMLGCDTTPKTVTVDLMTPLRCKQSNHLAKDLPFDLLLRLIIRRLRGLYALDGHTLRLPPEEFDTLSKTAQGIETKENSLTWRDWHRYSGRQNTGMQLGGLVGTIRYHGPTAAFSEYLDFASRVHLGKQTSFGLGLITVSPA